MNCIRVIEFSELGFYFHDLPKLVKALVLHVASYRVPHNFKHMYTEYSTTNCMYARVTSQWPFRRFLNTGQI